LVVLNTPVCQFAGENDPSNFCVFCGLLYRRVTVHMRNVHKKEKQIQEIEKLDDIKMRHKEYDQLIRKGNFLGNNAKAISSGLGFIIPTRKAPHFKDHRSMIHCTECYSFIEKSNYYKHQNACPCRSSGVPKTTLDEEKSRQVEL
jgi:hypothetical protein